MRNKFIHICKLTFIQIIWLFLLLAQHIISFNPFGDDFWYQYVVIVISAVLQYGLLIVVRRYTFLKWGSTAYTITYGVFALYKLRQILWALRLHSYPTVPILLCFLFDVLGIIIIQALTPRPA